MVKKCRTSQVDLNTGNCEVLRSKRLVGSTVAGSRREEGEP